MTKCIAQPVKASWIYTSRVLDTGITRVGAAGMSRLTELIGQVSNRDPSLGAELEREYRRLSSRRAFGLNFERHRPEVVELPGRPIRRGDKVRILAPRGSTERGERRLWRVSRIEKVDGERLGHLKPLGKDGGEPRTAAADDLVVVAEFRDPIHPGLVPTGGVHRGGEKPAHTVINGENFHVLKALTYTHRGSVDAIYIDPPYNTGARDWKYNNDYVDGEDSYRHSKWLAMMERRLELAKRLLNPEGSILIVTIDEKEYLRLGLLLEQTFEAARIQKVSTVISQRGVARDGTFSRVDEYIFFVFVGRMEASPTSRDLLGSVKAQKKRQMWFQFRRNGAGSLRADSPNLFYPLIIEPDTRRIVEIGEPLDPSEPRESYSVREDRIAVWPLREDGTEARWRTGVEVAKRNAEAGYLRVAPFNQTKGLWPVLFINEGGVKAIKSGKVKVRGRGAAGEVLLGDATRDEVLPKTVWNTPAHDAGWHGSQLLREFLPGRRFPYPKSLYAVEDALALFVGRNPNATILDFFAGSGTTAHAVMRLNRQDGGCRQSISVTNNEVSPDEEKRLRGEGLRPGDSGWEALGICDHITKPRIEAALSGRTPEGEPIKGDYKFTDEFPMAEGFEENAEFFTLTYENPVAIGHNRAFERVAALLWLRAGAEGRRIDALPDAGWDVADTYGILFDLDHASDFAQAVEKAERLRLTYLVTDDDRRFQSVAQQLPGGVEVVRLYESYLSNFRFTGSES